MKITTTPYTPPKTAETVARTASAKAEEKSAAGGKDVVALGNKPPEQLTYGPPKKLTGEQVNSIKESLSAQQQELLQAMSGSSVNQANEWLRSLGNRNVAYAGASGKLPPLATTQEGALAAISEGGAYSVDAVATRIFDMAKSMAGDDPALLEKMKDAVKKGFEAAGLDFKKATGQGLPDISSKTYDEVMKRFDDYAAELGKVDKK